MIRALLITASLVSVCGAIVPWTAAAEMADPAEIHRTNPDFVLHDPTGGNPRDWDDPEFFWLNEHVLVQPTADGALLATWTAERLRPRHRFRVMVSRSEAGGTTWSTPRHIDEAAAAWQVPVISPTGRIYLFYTYGGFSGGLPCRISDDHGKTWSDKVDLAFAKGPIDNPKPNARASWISPTVPQWDSQGRPLIGFTRWATNPDYPKGVSGHCQIEYFRIDNLQDNPDPKDLRLTWLNLDDPVTVPHGTIGGASYAQEPYTVTLPDGRLFVVMRSNDGNVWYSVSSDGGQTWRKAEPLRYHGGGELMHNPVSPCPVFKTGRGDYLFLFNNNDGHSAGHKGPEDRAARRPAYLSRGEFRPDARQPIWWSKPKLFIDNDKVPWGPPGLGRLEAATYTSLTEHQGRRILWYPDRKGFLLGKAISDDLLDSMAVPSAPGPEIPLGKGTPVDISAYFNHDTIINAPGDDVLQGYRSGEKSEYFATEPGSAAIAGGDGSDADGSDLPASGRIKWGVHVFQLGPLQGASANTILLDNDGASPAPGAIELDIEDGRFAQIAVLHAAVALGTTQNGTVAFHYTTGEPDRFEWDNADWNAAAAKNNATMSMPVIGNRTGNRTSADGLDFYRGANGKIIDTTGGRLYVQTFNTDSKRTIDRITFTLPGTAGGNTGIYALSGAKPAPAR